jgi:hypothetical protein
MFFISLCLLGNLVMQAYGAVSMYTAPPQSLVLVVVLVKLVHLILGGIEMVEQDPDCTSGNETSYRQTNVHPLNCGIVENWVQCLRDSGSEGVGEEVHGLHERLHGRRSLGVCVLETCD